MLPVEDEELLEERGGASMIGHPFEEPSGCQKTENGLVLLVTRSDNVCVCVRVCLQECDDSLVQRHQIFFIVLTGYLNVRVLLPGCYRCVVAIHEAEFSRLFDCDSCDLVL